MYFMEKESYWMSLLLVCLSVIIFFYSLMFLMNETSLMFEWIIVESTSVNMLFNFYLDWMSLMFFSFVSLIAGSVFFYSGSYMSGDGSFRLFMFLVLMFVFSMFFMVFSLNLVSMMLGWDGLGVISYILVVYYKNEKSDSAGMITVLSNRVGDSALLLSIAWFLEFGSWNYLLNSYSMDPLVLVLISTAAITKSAQIPFSAWLPAAMAAPTPVSALVHSSTLVTAGVYLMIRFSDLLMASEVVFLLVYLGMLTTIMSSVTALFEVDFKKVVALSTLSQLGIMVMTLSMGFVKMAFVHLLTHAVFKALLFMCSGKVIHSVNNNQDIRSMGGMVYNLPVTGLIMNLASLALCGVPFLSGFYSKDLIFESMIMEDTFIINYFLYMLIVGLSASYSFRLVGLGMVYETNQMKGCMSCEKDWVMLNSKMGLLFMSLISGAVLMWLVVPSPKIVSLNMNLKWFVFLSMVLGFMIGLMLCVMNAKGMILMKKATKIDLMMLMWNLPILSGNYTGGVMSFMSLSFKKLDLGWLEKFSGNGLNYLLVWSGGGLSVWFENIFKKFFIIFALSLMILMNW